MDVTILPPPVKSENDLKEYRIIKLANGLQALLISDLHTVGSTFHTGTTQNDQTDNSDDEESMDTSCSEDDIEDQSDADSDVSGSFSDEKEMDDNCSVKKSDSNIQPRKQAAAALCVGVGSFSDPDDIPGLAHFLEHMVFMGSSEFPDENHFDAFIKRHGGDDNASTDCERTVFQFEINPAYLRQALLIWAQFFISPLLKKESIDREVKAVDSEFKMALSDDSCRKEQVINSLCKPNHPLTKFLWGNEKSLKISPADKGIQVYDALCNFHKKYYNAKHMTLAVQSPEALDTLQAWVKEIFQKCPNNIESIEPVFKLDIPYPWQDQSLFQLCQVVPIKKKQELNLMWFLPPQQEFYKVQPLVYVSWLIGHEGKGSLLSLLKEKHLALSLNVEDETDCSQYSLLSIEIVLTQKGVQEHLEVMDLVFQYLSMLQKVGPVERIFQEIKKIEFIDFTYYEERSPCSNVEELCENLQLYPSEDILTGDSLLFTYDAGVIQNVLNALSPNRCFAVNYCPLHMMENTEKEHWFETLYNVISVSDPWKTRWMQSNQMEIHSDLHIPPPNLFIADKFDIVNKELLIGEGEPPVIAPCLFQDPHSRYKLWFKEDRKFRLPKAYIRIHLVNPHSTISAQQSVYLDLFLSILHHNMAELVYDAGAASLSYSIKTSYIGGLVFKVSGYNQKLALLLHTMIKHITDFSTTPEVFKEHFDRIRRDYYNDLLSPKKLCKDIRLSILEKLRFSLLDKYTASKYLNKSGLEKFVASYTAAFHVEGLIQGNYLKEEAILIFDQLVDILKCKPLPDSAIPSERILKIPEKPVVAKVKSCNDIDDNSVITHYVQCGPNNVYHNILMQLLTMIMCEPCFDILRTKQQLGYSVYVDEHNTSSILGFSVNVETQNSKFSVESATAAMLRFLSSDFHYIFGDLTEKEFTAQLASLIALKMNDDIHLGEEVDRNWQEIISRDYNFVRQAQEIKYLKELSFTSLENFYNKVCVNNKQQLTVQIQGNTFDKDQSDAMRTILKSSELPNVELQFLDSESNGTLSEIENVKNLATFQDSNYFYPVCHTLDTGIN